MQTTATNNNNNNNNNNNTLNNMETTVNNNGQGLNLTTNNVQTICEDCITGATQAVDQVVAELENAKGIIAQQENEINRLKQKCVAVSNENDNATATIKGVLMHLMRYVEHDANFITSIVREHLTFEIAKQHVLNSNACIFDDDADATAYMEKHEIEAGKISYDGVIEWIQYNTKYSSDIFDELKNNLSARDIFDAIKDSLSAEEMFDEISSDLDSEKICIEAFENMSEREQKNFLSERLGECDADDFMEIVRG